MLLPDNIHPELSIYYNGSLILQELNLKAEQSVFVYFKKNNCFKIS